MAGPSYGSISMDIGLSSSDLRALQKAGDEMQKSVDDFSKASTKIGLDKKTLQELNKASDNWQSAQRKGANSVAEIQSKILKMDASHQKAMAGAKNDAQRGRFKLAHRAEKLKQELRMEGIKDGIQKQSDALTKRIKKETEAYGKSSKDIAQEVADGIKHGPFEESVAEVMGSGLKDAFSSLKSADMKGMGKAMSKVSGGMQAAGSAPGAGGAAKAMGKMAPMIASLGTAAAALAAVVGPIALVVGLLWKADAAAKEMNSTITEGAGAADFAFGESRMSTKAYTNTLSDLRAMSYKVGEATRENAKDILSAMRAANEAGLVYSQMGKFVGGAGTEMEKYQKFAMTSVRQARMLGVSLSTISEQMATWSEDMGGSLDDMEKSFTMITKAAMQSGFGTKRLFTAVSQATSGTALYNSALDETIALMGTLSKSLGKSGASEFVKALQKGFAAEGYQDRFKRLMIAGKGDMAEIMTNAATKTTETFQKDFGERMQSMEFKGAGGAIGVQLKTQLKDGETGAAITTMAKMSEKQLRSLLTQAEQSDPGMARQLQTMIRLSKGAEGSLSEQAKGLDALTSTDVLATKITGGLGGKAISEMSALELAAFESYAGVSGEQLVELRRVDAQLRGQHERLGEIKDAYGAAKGEEKKALHDEFQKLGGNMEELAPGKALGSLSDFIQSNGEALEQALDVGVDDQQAVSEAIQRNTLSMSNILENKIGGLLNMANFITQGVWDATIGLGESEAAFRKSLIDGLQKGKEAAQDEIAAADEGIAAARRDIDTTKGGSAERKAAERALLVAQAEKKVAADKVAQKDREMENVRSKGQTGWGESTVNVASAGAEVGFDAWKMMGDYVTNPLLTEGAVALGGDREQWEQSGRDSSEMIEGFWDGAPRVAENYGVGESFEQGSRTPDEAAAAATEAQEKAEKEIAKKAHKDSASIEDEISDLPDQMARQRLTEELGAMDVAPKQMEKAIQAMLKGDFSTGGTGLDTDTVGKLRGARTGTAAEDAGPEPFDPKKGDKWGDKEWDGTEWTALAEGGIVTRPTKALIGEAGPEAVIPLGKGGGMGNNVSVNIYGGDTKKLYATLKEWGVV